VDTPHSPSVSMPVRALVPLTGASVARVAVETPRSPARHRLRALEERPRGCGRTRRACPPPPFVTRVSQAWGGVGLPSREQIALLGCSRRTQNRQRLKRLGVEPPNNAMQLTKRGWSRMEPW
jgi:hypothetical protein